MLLHCYRCEIFLGFYLYGVRTNYGVRSGGRGGGGTVGTRGKAANVTGISAHLYLFWRPRESLEG